MSLDFLSVLLPMLLTGLKLTLIIAVLGIVFAFVIGSLIGYALQCKIRILKWLADAYIWVIRGVPLIVLALYVYYVLPKIVGSHIPATTVGIIVISLNAGAFIAEIVRSALQGVPAAGSGPGFGLSPSDVGAYHPWCFKPCSRRCATSSSSP